MNECFFGVKNVSFQIRLFKKNRCKECKKELLWIASFLFGLSWPSNRMASINQTKMHEWTKMKKGLSTCFSETYIRIIIRQGHFICDLLLCFCILHVRHLNPTSVDNKRTCDNDGGGGMGGGEFTFVDDDGPGGSGVRSLRDAIMLPNVEWIKGKDEIVGNGLKWEIFGNDFVGNATKCKQQLYSSK